MKNFQSIFVILLVAICTHLVESQDCSMHKIVITCESISEVTFHGEKEEEQRIACFGADSINVTYPGSSVVAVLNSNGSSVTNLTKIQVIYIQHVIFKFIPIDITKKLPNLKALAIRSSELVSVSKKNLKQFGDKLEMADFSSNKIISIDADLFEYNPNLKAIGLKSNPIRYIHPDFFSNLKNLDLKVVNLGSAGCIDQDFSTRESHDIATFKWENENCTDLTATFATQNRIKESCEDAETSNPTTKTDEHEDEKAENALMLASKLDLIVNSIHVLSETLNTRMSALEEMLKKLERRLETGDKQLEDGNNFNIARL